MTPALLREAGELLYGDRWQTALADALAVNPRTVRAWYSGRYPILDGVRRDVLGLLRARGVSIGEWLERNDRQHNCHADAPD